MKRIPKTIASPMTIGCRVFTDPVPRPRARPGILRAQPGVDRLGGRAALVVRRFGRRVRLVAVVCGLLGMKRLVAVQHLPHLPAQRLLLAWRPVKEASQRELGHRAPIGTTGPSPERSGAIRRST